MTPWLLTSSFVLLSYCLALAAPASAAPADRPQSAEVERARTILREGLDAKDFVVRKEAITATGMVGRNEVLLARMEEFLTDKNVEVRLATVRALADIHSPKSETALRKTLDEDKVPEVSFAAAKALATLHDPTGTAALREIYDKKRKSSSGKLRNEKRSIFEEFHSTPSALFFIVGRGAGYSPVPGAGEGFSAITALLRDPRVSDRASVLFILCSAKTPESRSLLEQALSDEDWSVRAVAAQIIAHTAQLELKDSLPALFDDKHKEVRFRAAGAYLHLLLASRQATAEQETP